MAIQETPKTTTQAAEHIANRVLDKLVADPEVNLSEAGSQEIRDEVVKATQAVVMNQANQEPWYLSAVTWGSILAMLFGLLAVFGYAVEPADQASIVHNVTEILKAVGPLVAAIGGLIAWWGRWRAKGGLVELFRTKQNT